MVAAPAQPRGRARGAHRRLGVRHEQHRGGLPGPGGGVRRPGRCDPSVHAPQRDDLQAGRRCQGWVRLRPWSQWSSSGPRWP